MKIEEVQKRLDAQVPVMASKGLRQPETTMHIKSQAEIAVGGSWKDPNSRYGETFNYFHAASPEEALSLFEDWVSALPDAKQRKLNEFMEAVGKAIDLGRANGIEADFVNPLTVLMKSLSENAITHSRVPAE